MTEEQEKEIQETASETLKRQLEDYDKHEKQLKEQERTRENALPFNERTTWRKRHMYRGWMLEPVELHHEPVAGSSPFAITRSNYGYRVLNSPDLGTIDVDFDFLCGISAIHVAAQQKEALTNIRAWVDSHPEQSWRIYQTAGGLRMIRTDAPQPLDESYDAVYSAIDGADDLYRELCVEQNAFRARISPKVARIGCEYPSWSPYDYESGGWWNGKAPTQDDLLAYEMAARNYKTAELLEVVGSGAVHPKLGWALRHHDDGCRVDSALPMEHANASEYVLLASIPELIAFNDVYRPKSMAPDQVWDSLDRVTQLNVRRLEGCRDIVIAAYKKLDGLAEKYSTEFAVYEAFEALYERARATYAEDAKRYKWEDGQWQSPLESTFPEDFRYWQLKAGPETGSAIIRFLPSRDNQRYVRKQRLGIMKAYVSNILVVSDPMHPENNGKVFLFSFGHRIFEKIQDMMSPEFTDLPAVDVFDMKAGCNFKLRVYRIDGSVSFQKSSFDDSTPVGDDGVIAELKTRVFSLGES